MKKRAELWSFVQLCKEIGETSSSNAKTQVVKSFLDSWEGDVYVLCKLLLCKSDQRVYHLGDKKLVKVFASLVDADLANANNALLSGGDSSSTCADLWERGGDAQQWSSLSLAEIDSFLDTLTGLTKQAEQVAAFEKLLAGKGHVEDVRWLCRLVSHDLRINIGAKYVFNALHPRAFAAWKQSNDLVKIVAKVKAQQLDEEDEDGGGEKGDEEESASPVKKKGKLTKSLSVSISNGTPVKPMLARASKSYADAVKRCPNGMRVEIKYDGERLQVHKNGANFKVFSRSLKPVQEWKIADVKQYLPQATSASSVILDCEVLLVSAATGAALPFGTFNKHKKDNFKEAQPCLFVFDILSLEGTSLIDRPFDERRSILESNLKTVTNRIRLSEQFCPANEAELKVLMTSIMGKKMEGLVIKDAQGVYEPAARHWLKMKKDYLEDGKMADSADLVTMGAYYGSGEKGGLLSTLLLGVFDKTTNRYVTVCKCGNGLSDEELTELQPKWKQLLAPCPSHDSLPPFLHIDKKHTPDFFIRDPKTAPIYEIAGAEFSYTKHHTANISIRFPRFVRLRDDKDYASATTLTELQQLSADSKSIIVDDEDAPMDKVAKSKPAPAKAAAVKTKAVSPKKATPSKKKKAKEEEEEEEEEEGEMELGDEEEEEAQDLPHKPSAAWKRQLCRYDPNCKRHNAAHFREYAHPGKARPHCAYGAACTRRNPVHFVEQMHPDEF